MSKYFLSRIEFDLTQRCNLNCKGCSHFAPLVKNSLDYTLDNFKNDVKRLSELFVIKDIALVGGEPMLIDNVMDYINACVMYFPESTIKVISNGILKNKIERINEVLLSNPIYRHCAVKISDYPIINNDSYSDLRKKEEFRCVGINTLSNSNPETAVVKCYTSNCPSCYNGKIYVCSIVKNISIFEQYFDIDLKLPEDHRCIDIYTNSGDEILLKLFSFDGLKQSCKVCQYNHAKFTWDLSKKDISEWTTKF